MFGYSKFFYNTNHITCLSTLHISPKYAPHNKRRDIPNPTNSSLNI